MGKKIWFVEMKKELSTHAKKSVVYPWNDCWKKKVDRFQPITCHLKMFSLFVFVLPVHRFALTQKLNKTASYSEVIEKVTTRKISVKINIKDQSPDLQHQCVNNLHKWLKNLTGSPENNDLDYSSKSFTITLSQLNHGNTWPPVTMTIHLGSPCWTVLC